MGEDRVGEEPVLDFLYVDAARIAVYLSQFDNYGHLTAMVKAATTSELTEGGVSIGLGKLGGHSRSDQSLHKNYDAQWVAPLSFRDELIDRSMIQDELQLAGVGEFVLVSGGLSIIDLGSLKSFWSRPSMRSAMESGFSGTPTGNRHERRKEGKVGNAQAKTTPPELDMFLDVIETVPHTAQAYIRTGSGEVCWGGLRAEGLVTPASELMVSHGITLSGEWSVIGILDALPDHPIDAMQQEETLRNVAVDLPTGMGVGIGLMIQLAPLARRLLGRPHHAYGLTPLLIYREITQR